MLTKAICNRKFSFFFVKQVTSIITRKEDSVHLALKKLNTEVEFLASVAYPSQAEKKQCYVMEPLEAKKPIESDIDADSVGYG